MYCRLIRFVLMIGSCAIKCRESCQVGNQAALSGLSGVPQGCLSGAGGTVNVRKGISTERCMVLSDASKNILARMRSNASVPLRVFILPRIFHSANGGFDGRL